MNEQQYKKCPACGAATVDTATGRCTTCGFLRAMPFADYEEVKAVGDPTIRNSPYFSKEMTDWSRKYGLLRGVCSSFDMVSGQCATAGHFPEGVGKMDWEYEASRCGNPEKAKQLLEESNKKEERGRMVGADRRAIEERERTNLEEVKREHGFPVDVEEGDASKGCDCGCASCPDEEKRSTADQLWMKVNGRFSDVASLRSVKNQLKQLQRERGVSSVLTANDTDPISRLKRQILIEALEATLTADAWQEVMRQARLIVNLRITQNSTDLRTVVDEFIAG